MQSDDIHNENLFSHEVGEKEKRKLKALNNNNRSVWTGLGLFGMVGWSVAVPTLLGTLLGIWLDKKYPEHFSWALTFLITGLIACCLIAWNWISKENKEMHKKGEVQDE